LAPLQYRTRVVRGDEAVAEDSAWSGWGDGAVLPVTASVPRNALYLLRAELEVRDVGAGTPALRKTLPIEPTLTALDATGAIDKAQPLAGGGYIHGQATRYDRLTLRSSSAGDALVAPGLLTLNGTAVVNTIARGHTLIVLRRSDHAVLSIEHFDTWGSAQRRADLAYALGYNGVTYKGQAILCLVSYDAVGWSTDCDANYRYNGGMGTPLRVLGNGGVGPCRHAFIGIAASGEGRGVEVFYDTTSTGGNLYAEIGTWLADGRVEAISDTLTASTVLPDGATLGGTPAGTVGGAIDPNGGMYVPATQTIGVGRRGAPTSVEKSLLVPCHAFHPEKGNPADASKTTPFIFQAGELNPGQSGVTAYFFAPVVLPPGVTITQLHARLVRAATGDVATVKLQQLIDGPTGHGRQTLATADATATGGVQTASVAGLDHLVGGNAYVLEGTLYSSGGLPSSAIRQVRIVYTMPDFLKAL